jgi:hypothetical protein
VTDVAQSISSILFGFVTDFIKQIIAPFTHLSSLGDLVFGVGDKGETLKFLTFTANEWDKIVIPGEHVTVNLAYWALFLAILYMATMISKAGINPQVRANVLEMFGSLMFVNLMLHYLNIFYAILFTVNSTLVKLFQVQMGATNGLSFKMDDGIGWLFIWCVYLGLSLWANVYYLMRSFTLMLLMIFGPVFTSLFLFPQFRQITGTWMKELFSTILVQAFHAGILWVFLGLDKSVTDNWVVRVVILASFIPIAEGLKALFGLHAGLTGKSGAVAMATGAAGLASMFSAGRSALGKDSLYDGLENRYLGGDRKKSDSGGSQKSESISQTTPLSQRASRMLRMGKIASNFGKGAGTLLGSAVGMPFGPAGVAVGGMVGGKLGSPTGGFAGRVAMAGLDGSQKVMNNMKQSITDEMNQLDQYGVSPVDEYRDGGWAGQNKQLGTMMAVGAGAYKGLKSSVPSELRSLGKVGKTAMASAKNGFTLSASPNLARKIQGGLSAGISGGKLEYQNQLSARTKAAGGAAEFKKQTTQKASYVGGIFAGESGARMGASLASHVHPIRGLNQQIQEKGWEYSDLSSQHHLGKVRNVRAAITNEYSTILGEVLNPATGEYVEQRLTDYRGGDSTLPEGDVAYRDYSIQDGRLAPSETHGSFFYTEDSQGGKKQVNREYNLNPYDYFEDRNHGSEKYFRSDRFKQGIV